MPDLLSSLLPLHRIAASRGGGLRKELLTLLEKNIHRDEDLKIPGAKVTSFGQDIKTLQTMKSQIPSVRN